MKKVRYEEMLPSEVVEEREKNPLAYLPLGGIEWHGVQNPLGLDAVKVHEICMRVARKGGGLVMPALFWGENREKEIMEVLEGRSPDNGGKIAAKMKLDLANFKPGYMGRTHEEMNASYDQLLLHIYHELKSLGFKAVIVMTGHYPLFDHAKRAAEQFMKKSNVKIFVAFGFDLVKDLGYDGDHAGKWETSLMMELRPELVDMSKLPPEGEDLVGTTYNAREASREFGRKAVEAVVDRLVAKARELL